MTRTLVVLVWFTKRVYILQIINLPIPPFKLRKTFNVFKNTFSEFSYIIKHKAHRKGCHRMLQVLHHILHSPKYIREIFIKKSKTWAPKLQIFPIQNMFSPDLNLPEWSDQSIFSFNPLIYFWDYTLNSWKGFRHWVDFENLLLYWHARTYGYSCSFKQAQLNSNSR